MGKKLLAVASAGGHLVQLLRLVPAFGSEFFLVSTSLCPPKTIDKSRYLYVEDCNADEYLKVFKCFVSCLKIVLKHKPKIVITTGAAPGLLILIAAKLVGAKCIWFDSIANTEELSLGGKVAKYLTKDCFSQWEHVAKAENVRFIGSVL